MPTYTYACEACEREMELEQRISEAPLKKCPKCGKQKLRRLITGGNFILKGGGWYSDGYGSGKKAGGGGSDSSGSDSGGSSSGTGSGSPSSDSGGSSSSTKTASTS
jgi:putative FmdB family regulatory protein